MSIESLQKVFEGTANFTYESDDMILRVDISNDGLSDLLVAIGDDSFTLYKGEVWGYPVKAKSVTIDTDGSELAKYRVWMGG